MSDLAPPTRAGSSLRLTTTLGPDRLLLEAIEGEEHLSAPFRYRLRATAVADDLDAAALVGMAAGVRLVGDGGDDERAVHGVRDLGQPVGPRLRRRAAPEPVGAIARQRLPSLPGRRACPRSCSWCSRSRASRTSPTA